ncbi:MAG TPA: flavin reductase [Spirochaetales bacterium]|nr:flavin reductase [Spirochaetales bacterium]
MSSFKNLRIVDNFYQTSMFYPMPTMLISTLSPSGATSLGAYSLCFPYYIAGKEYYAMLLECRNSSNTAQNLLRTGVCAINFLEDSRRLFKETVRLGFPGERCEEKMSDCFLEMEAGQAADKESDGGARPLVLKDAYQVLECSWDDSLEGASEDRARLGLLEGVEPPYRSFNGITSRFGAHFILRIDAILMKERQYDAIVGGVRARDFPRVPVDYGYRDSKSFWYTRFRKPLGVSVPARPGMDLASVKYAADRIDPEVSFSDEACEALRKIPRIFLKTALTGIAEQAKSMDLPRVGGKLVVDAEVLAIVNDKRNAEKRG